MKVKRKVNFAIIEFVNEQLKKEKTIDRDGRVLSTPKGNFFEAYKVEKMILRYAIKCKKCKRVIEKGEEIYNVYIRFRGSLWAGKHAYPYCIDCIKEIRGDRGEKDEN